MKRPSRVNLPFVLFPSSSSVRVIRERAAFTQPRALAMVAAASQRRRGGELRHPSIRAHRGVTCTPAQDKKRGAGHNLRDGLARTSPQTVLTAPSGGYTPFKESRAYTVCGTGRYV